MKLLATIDNDAVKIYARETSKDKLPQMKFSYEDNEVSWSDRDYINRFGFQSWGVDYYKLKSGEYQKSFCSDYNKFMILTDDIERWSDAGFISIWETIFWPTPFDRIMEELRSEEAGNVSKDYTVIEMTEKSFKIYTKNFLIVYKDKNSISYTGILGFALARLLNCSETVNNMKKAMKNPQDLNYVRILETPIEEDESEDKKVDKNKSEYRKCKTNLFKLSEE